MEWDREQVQISRQVCGIGRTDNLRANMLHRGELCVCSNVKWDIGLINGHLRYTVSLLYCLYRGNNKCRITRNHDANRCRQDQIADK